MSEFKQRLLAACKAYAAEQTAENERELAQCFWDWPIYESPDVDIPLPSQLMLPHKACGMLAAINETVGVVE